MKHINSIFLFLLSILVFSCSENRRSIFEKDETKTAPFIINLQHYFSDEEANVSFPLWFNDSLIANHKIRQITRYTYFHSTDSLDSNLRDVKTYVFDDEGQLTSFHMENYYDGVLVGSGSVEYAKRKDEFGFCSAESKTKRKNTDESGFELFQIEEYNDRFLVYVNEETGNFMFFLKHKENWRTLSVDSILNPTPQDKIVFGTPLKPIKKYQVENTVNESNVTEYEYSTKESHVTRIKTENYPFKYHRYVTYDKQGNCTGFIDSTYSNTKFLARRVSKFTIEDALPTKLTHESQVGADETNSVQIEKFEYVFFESNKD